jgi:hypothetical protein
MQHNQQQQISNSCIHSVAASDTAQHQQCTSTAGAACSCSGTLSNEAELLLVVSAALFNCVYC